MPQAKKAPHSRGKLQAAQFGDVLLFGKITLWRPLGEELSFP